jgi:hypothetical protein
MIILGVVAIALFAGAAAVAWPVYGALLGGAVSFAWGLLYLRPLLND